MAVKSNIINMVVCLTAVCLVCAAILGFTYNVTSEPIARANAKALQDALSLVLPERGEISAEPLYTELDGTQYEYYVQTVNDSTFCWAIKSTVNGFGGPLTLLVGMEENGVVHATRVLSHSETPGLGAKCQTDTKFISQFEGFDSAARSLSVKKDGGDVDAITASTITSRAYSLAVANAAKVALKLQEEKQ